MDTMQPEHIEQLLKQNKRIFIACEENQSIMVTHVMHEDMIEYYDRITGYVIPDVKFCSICVFHNSSINQQRVAEIAGDVAVEAVIAGKQKLFARYTFVGDEKESAAGGLFTFRISAGF